ncbi:hypothetical protein PI125_g27016 [Phytophthora idaei]|nr:hypothetical protein PI125_g27016 [Phytophthora idaei]
MHRKQPRNRLDVIPTGITSANTVRGGGKERRGEEKQNSQTGTRTRVAWVKATYPNRLHYLGAPSLNQPTTTTHALSARTTRATQTPHALPPLPSHRTPAQNPNTSERPRQTRSGLRSTRHSRTDISRCLVRAKAVYVGHAPEAATQPSGRHTYRHNERKYGAWRRQGEERRGKAKFPNRDSNPGRVGESHVSEPPTLFGSTFS